MTDDYENRRAMASQAMVQVARLLRQQSTTSEQILWACLRNRRLGGLKFRRQHPVAHTRFSVDFLCYEAKLIVELDGEVHKYRYEADQDRQRILEEQGFQVMRFTNDDVRGNLYGVLMYILQTVEENKKGNM